MVHTLAQQALSLLHGFRTCGLVVTSHDLDLAAQYSARGVDLFRGDLGAEQHRGAEDFLGAAQRTDEAEAAGSGLGPCESLQKSRAAGDSKPGDPSQQLPAIETLRHDTFSLCHLFLQLHQRPSFTMSDSPVMYRLWS